MAGEKETRANTWGTTAGDIFLSPRDQHAKSGCTGSLEFKGDEDIPQSGQRQDFSPYVLSSPPHLCLIKIVINAGGKESEEISFQKQNLEEISSQRACTPSHGLGEKQKENPAGSVFSVPSQ